MADPEDPRETYSDAQAALALRRAASLQLEAAERTERHLVSSGESVGDGYEREDLVAAAREVGIDPAFLSVALAGLGPGAATATLDPRIDDSATRWLGTRTRSVSASRRFPDRIEIVWPALTRTCESADFGLRFDGVDGGHPLAGGVARFLMIRMQQIVSHRVSYTMLCFRMEQLEAFEVRIVLRPDGASTDVTVFVDLRAGVGRNLRWAKASPGLLAVLAGAGALAGFVAAGPLIVAGMMLLASGAGAGAARAGWRWSYRGAAAQLGRELERLLAELERSLRRDSLLLPAA